VSGKHNRHGMRGLLNNTTTLHTLEVVSHSTILSLSLPPPSPSTSLLDVLRKCLQPVVGNLALVLLWEVGLREGRNRHRRGMMNKNH